MRCTITGKNIKVTEGIRSAIESKLLKLDKYFNNDPVAKVVCGTDAGMHKLEITICYNKKMIRTEKISDDLYSSIEPAVEDLERKIRNLKTKFERKHKGNSIKTIGTEPAIVEEDKRIEKRKTYDTKPMYPEDACLEMEMIGHDFFVFVNAETDEVNVVYKRKKGDYGLISPEK